MIHDSLIVTNYRRQRFCDLLDNTDLKARNIDLSQKINEISELRFNVPITNPKCKYLKNENLVLFNGEYYIIKAPTISYSQDGTKVFQVTCKHLSSILSSNLVYVEEIVPRDLETLLKIALCYDDQGKPTLGWSVGRINIAGAKKLRGLEASEESPFSTLVRIAEKYEAVLEFDSVNMKVNVNSAVQENPVLDLRVSQNVKEFEVSIDTSELVTRLYCYGAEDDSGNKIDIMSVNPTGMAYIDNFSYFKELGYTDEEIKNNPSFFVRPNIWEDGNYVDAQELYEQGLLESKKSGSAKVKVNVTGIDVHSQFGRKLIELKNGQCVNVIDDTTGINYLCNVTSRSINYDDFWTITVGVANAVDYRNVLNEIYKSVNMLSKITTSENKISGNHITTIDASQITNLDVGNVTTEYLEANYASIKYLETKYLTSEQIKTTYLIASEADLKYASIGDLQATNANIQKLTADKANITDLEAINAKIGELVAGSITTDYLETNYAKIDLANIKDGCITTAMIGEGVIGNVQIADGSITDAKIVGLTANKITAGKLDAAEIEVINLNCANLTVGTINGQQIAPGAIDLSKLDQALSGTITTTSEEVKQALIDAGLAQDTADGAQADATKALEDALRAYQEAQAAKQAAGSAQTSADGKNSVYYKPTPPTGTFKVGDTWFNTAQDNAMSYWDGVQWKKQEFGAGALENDAVTADKIAQDVNQKIADAFANAGTANDKIDNLEIGARNLIKGTSFDGASIKYTHPNATGEGGFQYFVGDKITTQLVAGQKYTISMEVRGNARLGLFMVGTKNKYLDFVSPSQMNETEYTKVKLTFEPHLPSLDALYIFTKYRTTPYTEWFEIKTETLKLEKGTKISDWSPAPEDIDSAITDVKTTADSAKQDANTAKTDASTAKQEASNAKTEASSAKTKAEQASKDATSAKTDASSAKTTADTAKQLADTAKTISDAAKKAAEDAAKDLTALDGKLTTVESTVTKNTSNLTTQGGKISALESVTTETNKQVTAVKGEMTTAKQNITTLQTNYSSLDSSLKGLTVTVGQHTSSINTVTKTVTDNKSNWDKAGSALTTATDAKNKIDNLAIGGRNLIKNSLNINKGVGNWGINFGTVIPNQVDPFGTTYATKVRSTTDNEYVLLPKGVAMKQLGYYALSIWLKANKNCDINVQLNASSSIDPRNKFSVTTSWKRFTFVANVTVIKDYDLVIGGWSSMTDHTVELYISHPMLVYGDKPMDHSPAPEDIDTRITAEIKTVTDKQATFQTTLDGITGRVSSVETTTTTVKNTVDANKTNWDKAVTALNTANTAKTTAESAANTATTAKTAADQAKTEASSAKSTATSAATTANTAKSTADTAKSTADSAKSTATTASTNANNALTKANSALLADKVIPLSGTSKLFKNVASFNNDADGLKGAFVIVTPIKPNTMCRIHITGYNYIANKNNNIDLTIACYNYGSDIRESSYTNNGNVVFSSVKLAKVSSSDSRLVIILGGVTDTWKYPKLCVETVMTGFTTAPDSYKDGWSISLATTLSTTYVHTIALVGMDVQSEITTVKTKESNLELTVDQFKTSVASTYATKTQLNTVDGKFASYATTTAMNSAITAKANEITSNVSKTYATQATVNTVSGNVTALTTRMTTAESKITDTAIVSTVTKSSSWSTLNNNANSALSKANSLIDLTTIKDTRSDNQNPQWYFTNYARKSVKEFKYCSTVGLSAESGGYGTLITEVPWTDSSGGFPNQLFYPNNTQNIFRRVGTSTTAWSAWIQVAGSHNIVSTINQTAESIKISASKIDLSGYVTITNIGTAGKTVIDGGNVKTGTITATQIASNAITAVKIAGRTITADKLVAKTLTAASGVFADACIVTANIANLAVTSAKIANLAVGNAQIANAAITTAKIANLSITNALIANGAIDNAKISNLDAGKITTGTISADRIAAGSIVLGKLDTTTQNVVNVSKTQQNNYGYRYAYDIVIKGESNKYYPVVFRAGNQNAMREIFITRGYSEQAPADWYNATHHGGLTLKIKCNFGGWGGANYSWFIHDFEEMYTTMFAGAQHVMDWMGFAVFLRGGGATGAIYHIYSDQGINVTSMGYTSPQICYNSDLIGWSGGTAANPTYKWNAPAPRTAPNKSEINPRVYTKVAHSLDNTIATWCYNNDRTYINGGKLYTGTVTATQIAANAIVAGKIATNAVTAGTIVAGAVSADKLAANAVTAGKIAANAVTTATIAAGAVNADKISSNAILAKHISAGVITGDKLVAATITGAKIAARTITANNIVAGAITAAEIKSGTITATQIASGTITAEKLAISAHGYSKNPNFANWTSTFPFGFSDWASSTSRISKVNVGGYNVCQMVTGTTNTGMTIGSSSGVSGLFSTGLDLNGVGYVAVEIKFRLTSGTSAMGAGALLDFYYKDSAGASKSARVTVKLYSMALSFTINTWYTYRKIYKVPDAVTSGQYYQLAGYLMGNYSECGTLASKTIQFASFNVFSATEQDYLTQSWTVMTSINGGKIYTGSITATQIAASAITTDKLAAGAITADKIATNAITAIKIAAGNITSDKIAANAVIAGKIAANAVTAGTIAAGAITTDKLAAGAVTAAKIAASTITADKIAANAITAAKISTDALKSRNYVANSTGSFLNLADGTFNSKNLKWDSTGNLTCTSGMIAQLRIKDKGLWAEHIPTSGDKTPYTAYFNPEGVDIRQGGVEATTVTISGVMLGGGMSTEKTTITKKLIQTNGEARIGKTKIKDDWGQFFTDAGMGTSRGWFGFNGTANFNFNNDVGETFFFQSNNSAYAGGGYLQIYSSKGSDGCYNYRTNATTHWFDKQVSAPTWITRSREKYKTNIVEFSNTSKSALNMVRASNVYQYNLKEEIKNETYHKHYGFVVERETPSEIIADGGDGIDTYSLGSINWQATKELAAQVDKTKYELLMEINNLKEEIEKLKERLK